MTKTRDHSEERSVRRREVRDKQAQAVCDARDDMLQSFQASVLRSNQL
jgi:hypothetical protein